MVRQRMFWFVIGLLILSSLACNAFTGAVEPALTLPPPPTTTQETVSVSDVEGGSPEIAPTATLPGEGTTTGTAVSTGDATVRMVTDLNIRSGPSVQYDKVSFLLQGETARIIGKDTATGWWKIECPPRAKVSECWISDNTRYSTSTNTGGVPIAAVPPTPTPIPATPTPRVDEGGNGLLVYISEGRLWAASLNMNENPPSAGEPYQLGSKVDVLRVFISPDGKKVAYTTGTSEVNILNVVNVDGSENKALVSSSDLPVQRAVDSTNHVAYIAGVQWLADSQNIAFNTEVRNLVGPGVENQEDLYTVNMEGTLNKRFATGQGGGSFAVSRNNQVLMGQREAIVRANLDGSNRETVITFQMVNTASEYIYYPLPQWTTDGSQAYVAIPSREQFVADAFASLWMIPTSGVIKQLQSIPGNILFNKVVWTPSGESLAYVQRLMDGVNRPPALVLAGGDGQNQTSYNADDQLVFYEWSPNGTYFLYSGDSFFAIGRLGGASIQITTSTETAGARWLTASSFVMATGGGGAWKFDSGNLSGGTRPLVTANTDYPMFDVWAP